MLNLCAGQLRGECMLVFCFSFLQTCKYFFADIYYLRLGLTELLYKIGMIVKLGLRFPKPA